MPLDGGNELDLNTRVSVVLAEGADLIERNGWCQGKTVKGRQFCAFGAIRHQACEHNWGEDAVLSALARVEIHIGFAGHHNAIRWNDTLPADTGQQIVVDTLRRASGLEK